MEAPAAKSEGPAANGNGRPAPAPKKEPAFCTT